MTANHAPKRIRVLLADDHPVVREGLAALMRVASDIEVVGEAADGAEAVRLFRERRPDVALMDLRMPGMGGLEAIETIRRELPQARILVLTTFRGDEDIRRALEAGARGYLLKDAGRDEILDAVRRVHAGLRAISPAAAVQLAEAPAAFKPSARERQVLELVVRGEGNKQIADALGTTEGTVKSYVAGILRKLGVRDRTEAAIAAVQRGIVKIE
jgi:two-component system NarL family response regulator